MAKLDTAKTPNLTQASNSINSAGKSIERQSAWGRLFATFEELPFIGRLFQVIKIICEKLSNWIHSTKTAKELPPPAALKELPALTAFSDTLKQTYSGEDKKKSEVPSEPDRPSIDQPSEVDTSTVADPSDKARRQALLAQFEIKEKRNDTAVSTTDLRPTSFRSAMKSGSLPNVKLNVTDRPILEKVSEVDISTITDPSEEARKQTLLAQIESNETGLDAAISVADPISNQKEVETIADDLILPQQTATDQEVKASPKPGKPILKDAPTNRYSSEVVTETQRRLQWDPGVQSPPAKAKTSSKSSSSAKQNSSRPDAAKALQTRQELDAQKEQPNPRRLRAQELLAARLAKSKESANPDLPATPAEVATTPTEVSVTSTESSSSAEKSSSRPDTAKSLRKRQELGAQKEQPNPGRRRAQELLAARAAKSKEPATPEASFTPTEAPVTSTDLPATPTEAPVIPTEIVVTPAEVSVTSTESPSSAEKSSSRPDAAKSLRKRQELGAQKEQTNPGRRRAQELLATRATKPKE